MNRLRPLPVAVILALGLAACGASSGSGGTAPSQPASHRSAPPGTASPAVPSPQSAVPGQPTGRSEAGTQVITYQPWAAAGRLAGGVSAAATRSGSCFTTSSATTAPGAYRCLAGSSLYDPCFADASSGAGKVACPNPENPGSVVIMNLTAPLPPPVTKASSPIIPWLLVLANGQHCQTITGTGSILGGKNESYGCPGGGVYGQPDRSAGEWTVFFAAGGAPASAMVQMSVTRAYV